MGLINELKRRKVLRVAAIYLSAAFAILEGAEVLTSGLGLPEGLQGTLTIISLAGFPVAIGLAWYLRWSPKGIGVTASSRTPEGAAELADAAGDSLFDARTALVASVLAIFALGLGTGVLISPAGVRSSPIPAATAVVAGPVSGRATLW